MSRSVTATLAALLIAVGAAESAKAQLGLGIGAAVSTPVNLTLTAGETTGGTGLVPIVGLGQWSLKAVDKNAGATHGHLVPGALCSSTAALAAPLYVTATTAPGSLSAVTSRGAKSLAASASATEVAIGSGVATVQTTYAQATGANEQLNAACTYGMTVTYTVSPR